MRSPTASDPIARRPTQAPRRWRFLVHSQRKRRRLARHRSPGHREPESTRARRRIGRGGSVATVCGAIAHQGLRPESVWRASRQEDDGLRASSRVDARCRGSGAGSGSGAVIGSRPKLEGRMEEGRGGKPWWYLSAAGAGLEHQLVERVFDRTCVRFLPRPPDATRYCSNRCLISCRVGRIVRTRVQDGPGV